MRKQIKCEKCENEFTVKCTREGEVLEEDKICIDCLQEKQEYENEDGGH